MRANKLISVYGIHFLIIIIILIGNLIDQGFFLYIFLSSIVEIVCFPNVKNNKKCDNNMLSFLFHNKRNILIIYT